MPSTDDIRQRLDTASRIDPDIVIIEDDPLLLTMDSTSSDDEYTIVPNVAYCSCPDRQFRQVPCKHLFALAVNDSVPRDVRDSVVSGIAHQQDRLHTEVQELDERLLTLRERLDVWSEAAHATDDEHGAPDNGSHGEPTRRPPSDDTERARDSDVLETEIDRVDGIQDEKRGSSVIDRVADSIKSSERLKYPRSLRET